MIKNIIYLFLLISIGLQASERQILPASKEQNAQEAKMRYFNLTPSSKKNINQNTRASNIKQSIDLLDDQAILAQVPGLDVATLQDAKKYAKIRTTKMDRWTLADYKNAACKYREYLAKNKEYKAAKKKVLQQPAEIKLDESNTQTKSVSSLLRSFLKE